jgi:hypothetical protein
MIRVRVVTGSTPQLALRHLGAATLSKLLNLAGERYLLTLTLSSEDKCSVYILSWFSRAKISPIFSRIQDPSGPFKVTLLANALSRRTGQFGRIHYIPSARVAQMFFTRSVAPFAVDGNGRAIEMPSVRVVEAGTTGMTEQTFLCNRPLKLNDVPGFIPW